MPPCGWSVESGSRGGREGALAKALILTEKPSVARDIAEALGGFTEHDGYWESDAFVLTFAVGHLFAAFIYLLFEVGAKQ